MAGLPETLNGSVPHDEAEPQLAVAVERNLEALHKESNVARAHAEQSRKLIDLVNQAIELTRDGHEK